MFKLLICGRRDLSVLLIDSVSAHCHERLFYGLGTIMAYIFNTKLCKTAVYSFPCTSYTSCSFDD
jgi:hypothetical protein